MDRRIIFHMEDRGHHYIYHWFMYMVAGLRHIKRGLPTKGSDGGGSFERNSDLFDGASSIAPYNVLFMQSKLDYQVQTCDLLKGEFLFLEEPDITDEDIIVNNYGEAIHPFEGDHVHNGYVNSLGDPNSSTPSREAYLFLRELRKNVQITESDISKFKGKKFFLSRNRSHILPGNKGIKRRHIMNENGMVHEMNNAGIEIIHLEDYSIMDKIKLFQLSDTIISPNSGALVFCVFANTSTKIMELNVPNPSQVSHQYRDICDSLGIPYNKFICNSVDMNDNMEVNVNALISELKYLKS